MVRRSLGTLALVGVVSWMRAGAAAAAPVSEIHYTMGTYFSITVDGAEEGHARAAMRRCFAETRALERACSRYDPASELNRLNAAAGGTPQRLSSDLADLLRRALALRDRTGGAFDPAIGALTALWRETAVWPTAAALSDAHIPGRRPGVHWQGARRLRVDPGVRIDLDGIAKGYAVDRCVAHLRGAGIRRALVNFGESSQYALGAPVDDTAWSITVRGTDAKRSVGTIRLRDRALSASAVFGHSRALDGRRIGHIVDPSTGAALTQDAMALVVTTDATAAEALSKALLIWGEPALTTGTTRLRRLRIVGAIYVDNGRTTTWRSEAMAFQPFAGRSSPDVLEEPLL